MSGKELTGLDGPEARTGSDPLLGRPSATESHANSVTQDQKGRDLLLVLGMHRSGTSALTGVLEKLGVALGDELLPPSHDNPKGYFENGRVVTAQETMFAALHRAWHDPRPLPVDWAESVAADEARELLVPVVRDMFANTAVAAVKDPRSSRVVPLWLDVAAHAKARPSALLMIRHPNEVAGSLHKRDGLSRSRAHLLWMTYLLEAERATRELPRAFVSYEALLADWRIELNRMTKWLGVALPATTAVAEEIDEFLDVSLRNNQAEHDEQPVSPFEPMALELYGLALRCAADPAGKRADEEFDAITKKLGRPAARYLDAPLRLEDELQRQAIEKSRVDMSLQVAALRELWRPAFPSRASGSCRLYYREASASFVESRSVSADPVLQEDGRRVVFEIPAGARFDHLRMDPDDAPGVFAIQSLTIGGKPVDDFAQRVSAVSEFALPVTTMRDGIRFSALGEDPHFELNALGLGSGDADEPLQVEMHFRVETVLSEIVEYLRDSGKKLERGQQDLEERQRRLVECVMQFEQHLSGFGAVTRELQLASQRQHEMLIAELMSIRAQQDTLLSWARRRSPRYWWRRMRGQH